ncbi:glycosyltransferase [Candidatus Kaiserbacteria bacterium]|nr:glycosyltransferase [Candidatus Kaiserbacteria bacterium]
MPALLGSLRDSSYPLEVIIVDARSEDGTRDIVTKFAQDSGIDVILIDSSVRRPGTQRNMGARVARHPVLMFVDADVIVPSLDALLGEYIESAYDIANARLVHHPHEGTLLIKSLFATLHIFQRINLAFGRPFFAGACIIAKRDFFTRLSGFDESLALAEDVDLSRRAAKIGTCGHLSNPVSTSMRRLNTLRLRNVLALLRASPHFLMSGRAPHYLIEHYPFGNFKR